MDRSRYPSIAGHLVHGFPAHAGMDLTIQALSFSSASVRFPRPRGDGPVNLVIFPNRRSDGFPAHAGMDREIRCSSFDELGAVSPPTRGWTRYDATDMQLQSGLRFPRPRGDGPTMVEHLIIRRGRRFLPAHAGMDPRAAIHWGRVEGFPRPRGDGPLSHAPLDVFADGFPRPRGDGPRLVVIQHRELARGFPAHAGMDLPWESYGSAMSRSGFPRPRGDGPCTR